MPVETLTKPSNQANNTSQQNVIEESQVGDSSVNTVVPSNEETCDNELKIDDVKSKELSGLPATTEPLPHEITKNRRAKLKVRRKLFKWMRSMTEERGRRYGVVIALLNNIQA